MTPADLVPMRLAATVAHSLPGVRLRLRDGDDTLLEVARPPLPPGRVIGPCAFRAAVARAQLQLDAGVRMRFLGLDEGRRPTIDVGVKPGDLVHLGGIYRVAVGDLWVHAFPTTLGPKACRVVVASQGCEADMRLHHDAATNVTLVHAVRHDCDEEGDLATVLEDVLAACCADEIAADLARCSPRR